LSSVTSQWSEINDEPFRMWPILEGAHTVDVRSINHFKNCYFSPIQCVLVENR
uniref:FBA_1 domain-containing protein n=1 Tax=Dracunculus medinensis TaxID=318479 RepID=A0A0N4U6S7_DRAME